MLPEAVVAGPVTVSPRSEPAVMVVVSVTSLLAELTSGARLGTRAPMTTLPWTWLRSPTVTAAEALSANGGTVQVTVAGPVAGSGAQAVIVPPADSSVVVAGTISYSVLAGAGSKPLLVTVTW